VVWRTHAFDVVEHGRSLRSDHRERVGTSARARRDGAGTIRTGNDAGAADTRHPGQSTRDAEPCHGRPDGSDSASGSANDAALAGHGFSDGTGQSCEPGDTWHAATRGNAEPEHTACRDDAGARGCGAGARQHRTTAAAAGARGRHAAGSSARDAIRRRNRISDRAARRFPRGSTGARTRVHSG
jgi:hypothetical protein